MAKVTKPLLSIKKIIDLGNEVHFGAKENFIKNLITGDKVHLQPKARGSYVMRVKFPDNSVSEITIDSGAEENVCPWHWGQQFGMKQSPQLLNLVDASGGSIPHYGQREVVVTSPF